MYHVILTLQSVQTLIYSGNNLNDAYSVFFKRAKDERLPIRDGQLLAGGGRYKFTLTLTDKNQ